MADIIDLSSEKAKRAARQATAEAVASGVNLLFHDADRVAWANVIIDGHRETFRVESSEMRDYFRREACRAGEELFGVGMTLSKKTLAEQIEQLKAEALYKGPQHQVHLRVGEQIDGTIYIDLCDEKWRAIRVGRFGWEMIDTPPIFFRRSDGMLPLAVPEPGGSIDELRPFLNINPDDFPLVVAWLVRALRPRGPFPVLFPYGSAGLGKTTLTSVLLKLIDPNSAESQPPPRDLSDFYVTAQHRHCLSFDNVSTLSQRMSDAICRMSTGAGVMARRFYTQTEQVRFPRMARPQIFNSITELVSQPDLQSRSLVLSLGRIKRYKTDEAFHAEFDDARPRIFGALLDLLVRGVKNLPDTDIDGLPRMASFVTWAVACGVKDFQARYEQNQLDGTLTILEGDELANAVKGMMARRKNSWIGTSTELAERLKQFGFEAENSRSLSARLRRLAPAIRSGYRIDVAFLDRKNIKRPIQLTKVEA